MTIANEHVVESTRGSAEPRAAGPTRDSFIDALRTLAIGAVIVQHWLFPVLAFGGGTLVVSSALAAPGAWLTTWVGQVMPMVFFAGGAANAMSLRAAARRGSDQAGWRSTWLVTRVRRLAWPVLPLAAVWLVVPPLAIAAGLPAQPVGLAARYVGELVWFLAAYLLVVVAAPTMLRLHDRFGVGVVVLLAAAAFGTDALRFGAGEWHGYANLLFVWLAVHQLGFAYADGTLTRLRRRTLLRIAAAGYGSAALLALVGPYPAAMVGLPGAPLSNMNPPTACVLAFGIGQVALVVAARPRIARLLARPRPAAVLRWAVPRTMSLYLWHMPSLMLVVGVTVIGLGMTTPAPGSPAWLAAVPLWLGLLALVLRAVVAVVGRYEAPPPLAPGHLPPNSGRLVLGVGLVATGLLGVTVLGFGTPLWSLAVVTALAAGVAVMTAPRSSGARTSPGSGMLAA